ncbi:hypothetical protein L7F22_030146 [Adiantum nelumboides]|nr:hypothetical protein [Adiantum nelumboides]
MLTNTRARKIQLKNELNTIKKDDLSVNDYTLKIKALCESLSSIAVTVDDDDKLEACLCGLGIHCSKMVLQSAMSEKNMSPCYWAETASTAIYTMKRTPTATVHDITLEEKFIGKKTNVLHFKVFGCIAYVHVLNELRTKLDPKAEKCVFIGYSLEQKGYKCYNPITRQVKVSRDVVFDEMITWYVDVKDDIGANVKKSVAENSNVQSQVLSELQGSPAISHVANLWSERLRKETNLVSSIDVSKKGKEKVDEGMRTSNVIARHDDVGEHSSGFEHSLDEELGIPSVRTPGVKRLHAENRALGSNVEPCRSGRTYGGYVAKHFAFTAKIVQD